MDKILKIGLVGYGRFGKKYFKEIKKLKKFNLVIIFINSKVNKKFFTKFHSRKISRYKLDGAIIATPAHSHYRIARAFIENKIPIILEKPATTNYKSIRILNNLSIKNKSSVIINYSDLFNLNFLNLFKNKKIIGEIIYIKAYFRKFLKIYDNKRYLPYFDWFPHPLALIGKFFNLNVSPHIVHNLIYKKKKKYFQTLDIDFYKKKKKLFNIFFSNCKKLNGRKLLVYGKKGMISYDGYSQKNNFICQNKKKIFYNAKMSPLHLLLLFFYKTILSKKYYCNLKQGMAIHKLLGKISKKI